MTEYSVDLLTLEDYVWSVEVAGVRMLTDEVQRPELINRKNLYLLVDKMIADGTAFVCKYRGQPVGALGALLVPNTFNPDITTMAEIIWYVLPEYRNGRAGALLLKAYNELAEQVADECTLSLLSTSQVKTGTLLSKGYKLEEMCYRKQIKEK